MLFKRACLSNRCYSHKIAIDPKREHSSQHHQLFVFDLAGEV